MLGWTFVTRRLFDHMSAEIAWLRSELRYERARGDRALDMLATVRLGQPVATAYPAPPAEQAPSDAEKLMREAMSTEDFMGAGRG